MSESVEKLASPGREFTLTNPQTGEEKIVTLLYAGLPFYKLEQYFGSLIRVLKALDRVHSTATTATQWETLWEIVGQFPNTDESKGWVNFIEKLGSEEAAEALLESMIAVYSNESTMELLAKFIQATTSADFPTWEDVLPWIDMRRLGEYRTAIVDAVARSLPTPAPSKPEEEGIGGNVPAPEESTGMLTSLSTGATSITSQPSNSEELPVSSGTK